MLSRLRPTLLVLALGCTLGNAHAAPSPLPTISQPTNGIAAVVDDQVILQSDLNRLVQALKQHNTGADANVPEDILQKNALDQLILRAAQVALVDRNHAYVDDEAVDSALTNFAHQSNIPDLHTLQQTVDAQQPNGYAQLRQKVREDLSVEQLRQARVGARIHITDKDVDRFLSSVEGRKLAQPQVRMNQIIIPGTSDTARTQAESIANRLRQGEEIDLIVQSNPSLQGGGTDWLTVSELPADFIKVVQHLDEGQISDPIRLEQAYTVLQPIEKRVGAQTLITQRQARHILVKTSELVSNDDAKIKVDDLYQRLKGGANFADLARTYSDDAGSARNGGELGWVSPGDMVAPFDRALFATKIGTLSEPVQSQFGWHVISVEGERKQDMTQQYRRNLARQTLFQHQFDQELESWLREVRASAYIRLPSAKTDKPS